MLTKIDAVLQHKGRTVWSVPTEATVHDAVELMAAKRIEALLVLSGDKLVGILTERDCARRVTLKGADARSVPVTDVMTSPVVFVEPSQTVGDCLKILSGRGIAHLPVLSGGAVVGIVSMGDLVNAIIRDQHHTIGHFEGYFTGKYPG